MNIKEIVEKYLKDNGYDGLVNPEGECGCDFDDFMPCFEPNNEDCMAGYKHICDKCSDKDECELDTDPNNKHCMKKIKQI